MKIMLGAALTIAIWGSSSMAWADDQAQVAYSRLGQINQRILAIDAQPPETHDKFVTVMIATSSAPSTEPIRIWIERKSGTQEIPVDASGGFTLPTSPDLVKEDPMVHINRPKGTVKLEVGPKIKLPSAPFDYAYVEAAKQQIDRTIRAQAASPDQAPQMTALVLDFEPGKAGCGVTLKPASGPQKKLTAEKDGRLEIKLSPDLAKDNPLITPTCPIKGNDIVAN